MVFGKSTLHEEEEFMHSTLTTLAMSYYNDDDDLFITLDSLNNSKVTCYGIFWVKMALKIKSTQKQSYWDIVFAEFFASGVMTHWDTWIPIAREQVTTSAEQGREIFFYFKEGIM